MLINKSEILQFTFNLSNSVRELSRSAEGVLEAAGIEMEAVQMKRLERIEKTNLVPVFT